MAIDFIENTIATLEKTYTKESVRVFINNYMLKAYTYNNNTLQSFLNNSNELIRREEREEKTMVINVYWESIKGIEKDLKVEFTPVEKNQFSRIMDKLLEKGVKPEEIKTALHKIVPKCKAPSDLIKILKTAKALKGEMENGQNERWQS